MFNICKIARVPVDGGWRRESGGRDEYRQRRGNGEQQSRDEQQRQRRIQKLRRKDVEMATEDEIGPDLRRLLEPNALPPAESKEVRPSAVSTRPTRM